MVFVHVTNKQLLINIFLNRSESFLSFGITPDSLEASWMLVDSKQMNRWSTPDHYSCMLELTNNSGSDSDTFLDSLDTRKKYTYTREHR